MYSAPYYYYRRRLPGRGTRFKKTLIICMIVSLLLGVGFSLVRVINVQMISAGLPEFILGNNGENSVNLMYSAMPVLNKVEPLNKELPGQLTDLLVYEFFHVFRLDRQDPLALLEQEVPMLAVREPPAVQAVKPVNPYPVPVPHPGTEEKQQSGAQELTKDCLVAIYNTHTGETYALTDGMERLEGKKGGVVKAAAALEKVLEEKFGIRVVRSDVIHDKVYNYSYANSKETLEKILEENPGILAVFDIHRDAGKPREDSIVSIDGETVAPILICVGSDARASFPGWQNNYRFAKKLASELDKKYPGLCQGVRVMDGRYNQHLHPRALLLEIGSVTNSTQEAVRSAELLGEVLGPLILEIQNRDKGE